MFKEIIGYEGMYEINEEGIVVSLKNNKRKILKPQKTEGYLYVTLCKNGSEKRLRVHRLVAITFIPNPNNLPYVNHKDENKANNNVENLEWCTASYNTNYGTGIKKSAMKKWKPIARVDFEGNVVIYSSIKNASIENDIPLKQISQAIIRKIKCRNYEWYYAEYTIQY